MSPTSVAKSITLADYLFARLRQLGVGSIFGVPGDYNLRLLDFVEPSGLHWVGNCNELNAAYAADGYARIHGLSAVVTTYGVGELSAINAIAGAYAERAPVVHIVGSPARATQDARVRVHHTFADGEFRRFAAMHAHVTVAQANLTDPRLAVEQIDSVLEQAMFHHRPVYLEVPDDMVDVLVSAAGLDLPLNREPPSAPETPAEAAVVDAVLARMYAAKQPLLLVDGESRCLKIIDEIDQIVKATNWPTWTSVFGRGLVNEELPNVHGVYAAKYTGEETMKYYKEADLVLHFGPHLSDTNTSIFQTLSTKEAAIFFSHGTVEMGGKVHRDIPTRRVLEKILERLQESQLVSVTSPSTPSASKKPDDSAALTQKEFYPFVNPIFGAGDIILTETGTAAHGGLAFKLPQRSRFFTAVTWLSIGYMLPATLGAALALRDAKASQAAKGDTPQPGRVVLFIGDGSFQMTAQELSTIIKEKLDVTIFLINNNGYTIERVIHGRNMMYNDIDTWNHEHALGLFGMPDDKAARSFYRARTWGQLKEVLEAESFSDGKGPKMLEVFMEQEDCTGALLELLHMQTASEKK